MKKNCAKCGNTFDGNYDSLLCPRCAEESKRNVVRTRKCIVCGAEFPGYPNSKFCPPCSADRKRETLRQYRERRRRGLSRAIGSTDICEVCGQEYTVYSGLQKYCPDCSEEAIRAKDREMSKAWNAANNDPAVIRQQRIDTKAQIACRICGKMFFPGSGGQVTCSPECARENQRRKCADYDQKNREKIMERKKALYREKIEAMSPEEYREHREKDNARLRKAYAEKKAKKEGSPK